MADKQVAVGNSSLQVGNPHKKSKKLNSEESVGKVQKKSKKDKDSIQLVPDAQAPSTMEHSTIIPKTTHNEVVLESKKLRKRAADFMAESTAHEESGHEKDQAVHLEPALKASQKSKKNEAVPALPATGRPLLSGKDIKIAAKKKGKSAGAFHADKIDELLSKHYLEWPESKQERKAREKAILKRSLGNPKVAGNNVTLGGEGAKDENAQPGGSHDRLVTSLQAEAQHTVDREIEDEWGSLSDESGQEAANPGAGALTSTTQHNAANRSGVNGRNAASATRYEADSELSNDEEAVDQEDSDAGVPVEDNAAELLVGFDSDDEDNQQTTDFNPHEIAPLPADRVGKKTKKNLKRAAERDESNPGTIYIGRIPHGFYEHQMRAYFSQFGNITKLRLARNRRTGASKHFAFIEFESDEVARIAAAAMDNYLMFGHILRCKYAPQETLHPDVWKGANRRFKKIPYNKLEKRSLEAPKSQEYWERKFEKEQRKREKKKAEMLERMGYELELPKMKRATEVFEQKGLASAETLQALEDSQMHQNQNLTGREPGDHLNENKSAFASDEKSEKQRKPKKGAAVKAQLDSRSNEDIMPVNKRTAPSPDKSSAPQRQLSSSKDDHQAPAGVGDANAAGKKKKSKSNTLPVPGSKVDTTPSVPVEKDKKKEKKRKIEGLSNPNTTAKRIKATANAS